MKPLIAGFLVFACLISCPLAAIEIKLLKEVRLDENTSILQRPSSFIRTKDDLFVISDFQAGDLKVFKSSGELLRTFGRKGQGPEEFLGPLKLSYWDPFLSVADIDKRMIILISAGDDKNLKISDYFPNPSGADYVALYKDRMTISGYYLDAQGVAWSVYQYNLKSKEIFPVFLWHEIFGFSSKSEFDKNFLKKVAPFGMKILCEQGDEDIFAVWNVSLNVFRKNIRTGEVKNFGQHTSRYVQPKRTRELEKAKKERDINEIQQEIDNFSLILAIAVTDNVFTLIYRDPRKQVRIVQVYDSQGNFLGETEIPSPAERGMYYISKEKPHIYELSYEESFPAGSYKIRTYQLCY